MRLCRTCGQAFHKGDSTYPYFCSPDCHAANSHRCLQCDIVVTGTPPGRFCTAACTAAHYHPRPCQRCDTPVPPPTTPPFNRMPRYCSDTCRTSTAISKGKVRPWQQGVALELTNLLEYLPTPLHALPIKGHCTPYNIPPELAPSLPATTAKLANSIAWWNHWLCEYLPQQPHHRTLIAAHVGRTGWGGPSTPTGCLPMTQCWPYISNTARRQVDTNAVLNYWRIAEHAYPATHAAVQRRKQKVNEWLVEFQAGDWTTDPRRSGFFKADEVGSSPFVRKLHAYLAMYTPPQLSRCYAPEECAWLESNAYEDLYQQWETKRNRTRSWRTANYADDPAPHPDRTATMIGQVLAADRLRAQQ